MDWADDVAYCVHDLEDGVAAGLVDLPALADPAERDVVAALAVERWLPPGAADAPAVAEVLAGLAGRAWWPRSYDGTARSRAALARATSELVARLSGAAALVPRDDDDGGGDGPVRPVRHRGDVVVAPAARVEAGVLKAVTDRYVMSRPGAVALQARQREVLSGLVDAWARGAPPGAARRPGRAARGGGRRRGPAARGGRRRRPADRRRRLAGPPARAGLDRGRPADPGRGATGVTPRSADPPGRSRSDLPSAHGGRRGSPAGTCSGWWQAEWSSSAPRGALDVVWRSRPTGPSFLTADELETLRAVVDVVVPADGDPGAVAGRLRRGDRRAARRLHRRPTADLRRGALQRPGRQPDQRLRRLPAAGPVRGAGLAAARAGLGRGRAPGVQRRGRRLPAGLPRGAGGGRGAGGPARLRRPARPGARPAACAPTTRGSRR